jgi:hypothetical protein
MSTTNTTAPAPAGPAAATFTRILDEGYGPGAWYGSDFRAAILDVTADAAFRRPAPGRHNIAEVVLHHAYWIGQVTAKLAGGSDTADDPPAFPLVAREDWFNLDDESQLSWGAITALVDASQQRLRRTASEIASGARVSPLSAAEQVDLVLGITGHAAYHAGQIQLVKKLI